MARTIQSYFDDIKAAALSKAVEFDNADAIAMFNNTSRTAVWKVLFWAGAYLAFLIDTIFDLFRVETDTKIQLLKPGTLKWYAEKIKTFQYGRNTIAETDTYDNTGLTDDQIETERVVKYSAAVEQLFSNGRFGVRVKVAGETAGVRSKLPDAQLDAAIEFGKRYKFAGTWVEHTSDDPDYLKLSLRVYYNPLVLNAAGERLDGTNATPLQSAIQDHLDSLPFNGRFNLTALVDAMQKVDGIIDPRIVSAQTKYAALPYAEVIDEMIPYSGYLNIYDSNTDLTINWIAKSAV